MSKTTMQRKRVVPGSTTLVATRSTGVRQEDSLLAPVTGPLTRVNRLPSMCDETMKETPRRPKRATADNPVESLEIFPWISDFETGIVFMDQDHRTLVCLLNDLARSLVVPSEAPSIEAAIRELEEYSAYHFEAEVALLRQFLAGDALESEQYQAHGEFAQKIAYLKQQGEIASGGKKVEELVALLSRWLADHILGADRRMAKVVLALQAGMPLEAARLQADAEMSGTVKGLIASVLDMYEKLSARTLDLLKEQVERNSVGAPSLSMQQIEWNHIQHVLHEYGGNISAAARNLGMHRRTLQRKLHKPPE